MSGTELSRVRTGFRLRPPEPIEQSASESRRADIVMQSCGVPAEDVSAGLTYQQFAPYESTWKGFVGDEDHVPGLREWV